MVKQMNRQPDSHQVQFLSIKNKSLQCLASFVLCVVFLSLTAAWNRFPFVFSDSGTYIDVAITHFWPGDRSALYSLFIYPLHLKLTLWPVVLVQAAMTWYLVRVFFRTFARAFREEQVVLSVLVLGLCSSAPWFVGQIMPDVFAALLILAIATAVIGQDRLARFDRVAIPLLIAFFITTHLSYLIIASGTLALCLLIRLLSGRPTPPLARVFTKVNISMVAAIALGVLTMLSFNIITKRGATLASTGNVMLLGKLIDQGIALDYMTEACPSRAWPICATLPELKQIKARAVAQGKPIGAVSDTFLWGGPLVQLGGMTVVSKYASEITNGAMRAYPSQFLQEALRGFLAQTVTFQVGDDMIRYNPDTSIHQIIERHFDADTYAAFQSSRQYQQQLHVDRFRIADNVLLGLSALVVAGYLLLHWRSNVPLAQFTLVVLGGMVLNTMVTGALSAVHDRYGSRVSWLVPLIALFIISEYIRNKTGTVRVVETGKPRDAMSPARSV